MAKTKSTEFNKSQSLLSGLSGTATADPVPEEVTTNPDPVETPESTPDPEPSQPATEQAPEAAVESTTSPADASAASQYLERIKELGFNDVESEQDALDRLIKSYQQQQQQFQQVQQAYQQVQPYVQYGQQYLQQLQNPAYQQAQAQMQQPKAPEPAAADVGKWWNPPAYDPVYADRFREVVVDPVTHEKRTEWKPNTPAEVRASAEAFQAYKERWVDQFVNDPQKALEPFKEAVKAEMMNEVRQALEQTVTGSEQQREVQSFAQRIKEENAEWMFEHDPRTGRIAVDPINGQPQWSQQGILAARYIEQAEQMGIKSPEHQWNWAVMNLQALAAQGQVPQQQQQVAPPQPQQVPPVAAAVVAETKKQELLNRGRGATSIPSRGGSEPPSESDPRRTSSQNKNASAGKKFLTDLKRNGTVVGA